MRRILAGALLLSGSTLSAQSFWDTSVRTGPQFHSYSIKAPINEKVSQIAVPVFVLMPVMPSLTIDIGTSFAMVHHERITTDASGNPVTVESELSGLTDTQLRANYSIIPQMLVLTAGVNIPTGSSTVEPDAVDAASFIGSDFLTFPVSSFGTGLGFTGGLAYARPVGSWNFGAGVSLRQATEYEPFKDATGTAVKFTPGSEYRARLGVDRPFGTGRMAFGLTFSKFGEDKVQDFTYNTGDRFIGQLSLNNSIGESGVDYSFVLWNLYRATGTQIDQNASPSANITNASVAFGVRGPAQIGFEPMLETRMWTEEGSKSSFLGTVGMRMYVERGRWAIIPGGGFSVGSMQGSSLNGFKATLGMRFGS
jgi:hypothetical protein